jgi:hypothetical protein
MPAAPPFSTSFMDAAVLFFLPATYNQNFSTVSAAAWRVWMAVRIRAKMHYDLLARPSCADNIARARELLAVPMPQDRNAEADTDNPNEPPILSRPCPCCGGRMITIETFERGSSPRHRPIGPIIAIRIDSS